MHTTTALHATPKHIAIIMDGNRRWAAKHKLSTLEGHRRGAEVAGQIIEACGKNNIAYLTLYVFSTENFQRPPAEVAAMMELLQRYIDTKLSSLLENNVVLKISGNLSYMPSSLQKSLAKAVATTKDNTGLNLILALGYSSQEEITLACQQIALKVQKGDLTAAQITPEIISNHLYIADIPPPDMFIRTSGEYRVSNFLLWQIAYSEMFFVPTLWPDFSAAELQHLLVEYTKRERRYGLRLDEYTAHSQPSYKQEAVS